MVDKNFSGALSTPDDPLMSATSYNDPREQSGEYPNNIRRIPSKVIIIRVLYIKENYAPAKHKYEINIKIVNK